MDIAGTIIPNPFFVSLLSIALLKTYLILLKKIYTEGKCYFTNEYLNL